MFNKVVAVALAALALSGCSYVSKVGNVGGMFKRESAVTINWYCLSEDASGVQTCQKRKMQNGKPVDDVVLETIVIPAEQAPPVIAKTEALGPSADAGGAVAWSRKTVSSVNAIPDAGLQVENLGPAPRQTKNSAETWRKIHQPKQENQSAKTASKGGYTLQLGAFSTPDRCNQFVSAQSPRGLALNKRNILSRGTTWCVVTHGKYPSESAAVVAARQYAEKYRNLSFWVRSQESIQALEITQEASNQAVK